MTFSHEQLLDVLRIGHASSMRGEGFSLRDAIARSGYRNIRKYFDRNDLIPLLKENPDLISQWLRYCEDKRTSGGYWVSEQTCEVGSMESPHSNIRCETIEVAIAEYVLREIDYWIAVADRRTID